MKCTIKIDMDNAAFDETPATELARILRDIAEQVEEGLTMLVIQDVNGNDCGKFKVSH